MSVPEEGGSSPSSGRPSGPEKARLRPSEKLLNDALDSFQRSQEYWRRGDSQNAVSALDQAYRLILQVNPEGDLGLAEQQEKLRLLICRRMVEIYASRHTSASGPQQAIPLVLNRYVEREINLFRGSERKFFLDAYRRSGQYRPMITDALEKAGLPKELSWLPLIESGFRAEAFSRARALGLWQFIPSTGYRFGLRRDNWVDERMDPQKSTRAAIAYLRELHNIFGDWCTVMAAYNCGEARVLEVIRAQRINYLDNFWDLFEKLPRETARYVPRFMATLHMINNPGRYGLDLEELRPPPAYESARVSRQVSLKDLSNNLSLPAGSLEALNPELRLKITPPGPYDLKVPVGKGDLLRAKADGAPLPKPNPKTYTTHRVQRGETLAQLAGRYHTTAQAIASLNQVKEGDSLRAGQELRIPAGGKTGSGETGGRLEVVSAASAEPLRHRVKKGDTLGNIAVHYRSDPKEIIRLNKLPNTLLQIDQVLLIPPGKDFRSAGRVSTGSGEGI
jgi:membrane-bound lytic murein transglycosylase D